jgi:colanic acid biosynthesis glycosyl transferase WcaI
LSLQPWKSLPKSRRRLIILAVCQQHDLPRAEPVPFKDQAHRIAEIWYLMELSPLSSTTEPQTARYSAVQGDKPTVALVDYGNYPFLRSASVLLAGAGQPLFYLFSSDVASPNYLSKEPEHPNCLNISIGESIARDSLLKRAWQERQWGIVCSRALDKIQPEHIVLANTPLLAQVELRRWCRDRRITYSVWTQDLHGLAIPHVLAAKFKLLGRLLGIPYKLLDRAVLRGAKQLIAISEDQLPYLRHATGPTTQIRVIHNWADPASYRERPKDNSWSRANNLHSTFNFLYSGALGFKQDLTPFLALARRFRDHPDIRVIVISEGVGMAKLKAMAAAESLGNICFLPFQEHSAMADVYGSADVLLVTLRPQASSYCVPSKVLTYLCAAKAQLVVAPSGNLSARLIEDIGAGIVVSPDAPSDLTNAASLLRSEQPLRISMAASARAYTEHEYSDSRIRDRMFRALGWPDD